MARYGFSVVPRGPGRVASCRRKSVLSKVRTWWRTVPGGSHSAVASSRFVIARSRQSRRIRVRSGWERALASAKVGGLGASADWNRSPAAVEAALASRGSDFSVTVPNLPVDNPQLIEKSGSVTSVPSGPAPRGGWLLRHRDFRRLWAGETVSEMGSQITLLAMPLIAVRALHATTFQVGLLMASSTVAFLIVGLPAGAVVDRLRGRQVMIAADLGRVAAIGSVPIAYGLGHLGLVQLYCVTLAAGVFTVFFDVAYQSYLPSLVGTDHVVEGNAKLTGSAEVAQIVGPSLAGGLVQAIGGPFAVALDAGSYLWSGAAVGTMRANDGPPPPHDTHLVASMREGLWFVFKHPVLRAIAATTATGNLFGGIMTAVEVPFLVRSLHAAPGVIGLLFAAVGVGGVLGAFAALPAAKHLGGARSTRIGIYLTGGGLLIPLARPGLGLLLFAGGYSISAFGTVVYNINQVSFRQRLCPEHLLGRMNATMRFVVWGVLPLGALLGGTIGAAAGLRPALWIAAIGQVTAAVWLLASPIRTMRDFPKVQ